MKDNFFEKAKKYCIDFYNDIFKKEMQKKFLIVLCIICVLTFGNSALLQDKVGGIINSNITPIKKPLVDNLLNEIITVGLLVLSSIVPNMYITYFAIPVVSLVIASEIIVSPNVTIYILISAIFKIIAYSLAIVLGGLLCKKNTIAFKKASLRNDSMINIKRDLLLSFNKDKGKEKIEKIDKKIKDKMQKLEDEDKNIILNFQVFTVINILVILCITLSTVLKYI